MLTMLLFLQTLAAPTNVTYRVVQLPNGWIDTVDVVEVSWTAVPGANGYHVRLVDSALVLPPWPNDVDAVVPAQMALDPTGGWHQFTGTRTVDTGYVLVRKGERYPTKAIVRAVNGAVLSTFGVSSSQGLSRCPCSSPVPPPPAPPPAPPPPPPPPPAPPPSTTPVDTLWGSWTWRNGNYVKVFSRDSGTERSVRFDLKSGTRTTSLPLSWADAQAWGFVANALMTLPDSGQLGPFYGADGYRLNLVCRRTTGCTLTLKRPLLWGTTTFTVGTLPMSEWDPLRRTLYRATRSQVGTATWPYVWKQP